MSDKLKKGDLVVYQFGSRHGSNGSLAVVTRAYPVAGRSDNVVDVHWISARGSVVHLTNDGYDGNLFEKLGHIEASDEVREG